MDYILSGAETIQELRLLYEEMTTMLHTGGFKLSKWATSNMKFAEELKGKSHMIY